MRLKESLVDVEDDVSHVEDVDDDVYAGVVDRMLYGWKFVATIDILLDEQVHVVAGFQILFSLLLLHFHNLLLHRLPALAPPKLQKVGQCLK
jgi:hypothetical protein